MRAPRSNDEVLTAAAVVVLLAFAARPLPPRPPIRRSPTPPTSRAFPNPERGFHNRYEIVNGPAVNDYASNTIPGFSPDMLDRTFARNGTSTAGPGARRQRRRDHVPGGRVPRGVGILNYETARRTTPPAGCDLPDNCLPTTQDFHRLGFHDDCSLADSADMGTYDQSLWLGWFAVAAEKPLPSTPGRDQRGLCAGQHQPLEAHVHGGLGERSGRDAVRPGPAQARLPVAAGRRDVPGPLHGRHDRQLRGPPEQTTGMPARSRRGRSSWSDDGTHRYDVPLSGATRVFVDYVLDGGGHPAYQDIKIPMAANGIDRAVPAGLALGLRYGGTGTLTVGGVSFQ